MNTFLVRLIIISFSTGILIIGSIIYLTQVIVQNQVDEIIRYKSNQVRILSDDANAGMRVTALALNMTANSPVFRTIHPELINEKLYGIPSDAEPAKRELADELLTNYNALDYVFFLLPDGKMYFLEPYGQQMNLTKNNFAYRDYYKGVMSTHGQYISEVYLSNNNKHHVVAIATPVYSRTDSSLMGIWVGALNLKTIDNSLSLLKFGKNTRLVYLDQHGNIVADSSKDDKSGMMLGDLESYKNALDGREGTMIETMNGTKMFVAYAPLRLMGNTWVVMLIQPYDDAYASEITAKELLFTDIPIVVIILSISGYYVYRLSRQNTILVEKLKEDDIRKEEFTTMVSHELKTPLVTISGYAEMLQEKDGVLGTLNDEQIEAVEKISTETVKLERLVMDILDAQKIDLKRMNFNKIEFKIDEFLDEQIQIHSKLMNNKKIHFVNTTTEKMNVTSDPQRLSQVFANLIKNAVDFVPPNHGTIEINAQSKNDEVIFYVKDNGSGVPKEKQEKLFKKFYQVDTSLKRSHGGTGLGLVICRGIVEALGGKIWLESEVGKGTIIFFTIPKNDSNENHEN